MVRIGYESENSQITFSGIASIFGDWDIEFDFLSKNVEVPPPAGTTSTEPVLERKFKVEIAAPGTTLSISDLASKVGLGSLGNDLVPSLNIELERIYFDQF